MKSEMNITVIPETVQPPISLIETDWLEQNLEIPDLLVFDCAVIAGPNPDIELRKTFPFSFESGQSNYDAGHIPGASFIDIVRDLCDTHSPFPLMVPPIQQFVEEMSGYGIGHDSFVVLYSSTEPMWAARVWWMLRAFGFDNAVILDGGWAKWVREERPVSKEACAYTPRKFFAYPRSDIFASKEDVLRAIKDESTSVINALPAVIHKGSGGPSFGRTGRIVGSVNMPSDRLHDPDTGTYLSFDKLRKNFNPLGVDKAERIVTYCGGGVASSNIAFALTLLGYENIAVYDASMFEWGNDPSLPMEMD